MIEDATTLPAANPPTADATSASANPAISRCCEAMRRSFTDTPADKSPEIIHFSDAAKAYRKAMPELSAFKVSVISLPARRMASSLAPSTRNQASIFSTPFPPSARIPRGKKAECRLPPPPH